MIAPDRMGLTSGTAFQVTWVAVAAPAHAVRDADDRPVFLSCG